ncbi:MAG: hypothetical protein H6730_21795 [Deltaproteobacteria bacterium]|nr:hypothetical protein [Deltaproteobacteria bacterium]
MSTQTTWKVLPHGPLEQLEENLWRVEGALAGMPLKRVMTVARRSDGKLVLHNGIALEEPLMAELEALGEPAVLVVPNGYHRLDAPAYKARYPKIEVVCPKGARKKVEEKVPVDRTYDEVPEDRDVVIRHVAGLGEGEGVMVVRSGEHASLVLNDLVFNMPHVPGVTGFVLRHVTQSTGGPHVTRIAKLFLIKDKKALRADLEALAATPGLVRIIVSHHLMVSEDPAGLLRSLV